METVKTATGKEYPCDYFNPCPPVDRLNLRIVNTKIAEVASIFSNSEETNQLWCGDMYAARYNRLVSIMPEDGAIRVVLGR